MVHTHNLSELQILNLSMNFIQESELVELEASVGPSWDRLAQPLEKVGDRLEVSWGAVQHLKAVKDSEELRKAVEEVQVRRDTDPHPPPPAISQLRSTDSGLVLHERSLPQLSCL